MTARPWPVDDWQDEEPPDGVHLVGEEVWPEPEDRGRAVLSELGVVEYVEDLLRPGRIVVHAAEEGSGKTTSEKELAIRIAVAGGSFAGTWPVLRTGNVLGLSEMHGDDDFVYESQVLGSLGVEREALVGRLFRLHLMLAANGKPALTVARWRTYITSWMRDHKVVVLLIDTATGATQVDPWGKAIQEVYANLRIMLAEYPELAIVLAVHVRKPTGKGERRLSDVLGEWGRWCDVVMLQENDGTSLDRAKITVRKRVRRERRIVATKAGGLLIDPKDTSAGSTKIPVDEVYAAVALHAGCTYADLGAVLEVSKVTAANYVKANADQFHLVKSGPKGTIRVYTAAGPVEDTTQPPNPAKGAGIGGDFSVPTTDGKGDHQTAKPLSIGLVVPFAVVDDEERSAPEDVLEDRSSIDHEDDAEPDETAGRTVIDGPAQTVDCTDYKAHQRHHVQRGGRWVCEACEAVALP